MSIQTRLRADYSLFLAHYNKNPPVSQEKPGEIQKIFDFVSQNVHRSFIRNSVTSTAAELATATMIRGFPR